METRKVLAALAYFSIFFLGFVFPAVLYFVSDDRYVKEHAKAAFLSHCIPVAAVVVAFVGMLATGIGMFGMNSPETAGFGTMIAMILLFGAAALVSLAVTIWNVYKGIKILL